MPTAKKDTYGIENVSGMEIRRFVREGDEIPAGLDVPSEDVVDDTDVESEAEPTAEKTKAKK